jgi:sodium transport system permease protein
MTTVLRQVLIVFRKELKDSLRDRRALFPIIFSILVYPAIISFMMNRVAAGEREVEEINLPVVGRANAPALVDWLDQQAGVYVVDGPKDPEQAVREQREAVVLVIPKNFAERFRASRPAEIQVVSDSSRTIERGKAERVRRLLARYSSEIASLRLVGRGISPVIAAPLDVNDVEVSSAQQRAATTLAFIPMMALLAAFTGGMQVATDSTAGERERGSLEPLLVNPAPRGAIVSGKWLASVLLSAATVSLMTIITIEQLRFLPLSELGLRFRFGPPQILGMLAVLLPMCPLVAAVQMAISTFARSFKEAQSYMGFLMLLPMAPAVVGAVYPISPHSWMYPMPMLGHYVLLIGVLGGRTIEPMAFAICGAVSLVLAALLVRATARLFRSERIIFGR